MKRTSRDIRVANRFRVLRQVIAGHMTSRRAIAAATDLSLATVAHLIGELIEAGVVVEAGFEDSGGGRPRELLSANAGGGLLVGVDVAETYMHAELYTSALTVLAAGDPVAAKVVTETARYLGVGIADLVNLVNPEVIVLSGWVAGRLGEALLPEVRAVIARHALRRPLSAVEIVLCPLVRNPVCLGAATFALEGNLSGLPH